MKRRKPIKKSATYWRKKCVAWAKIKAKERDNYTCQYCGRNRTQVQIHGSHILPEGTYISMSADVDNIIALCGEHHMAGTGRYSGNRTPSWHGDPLFFAKWFEKKWPGREQELRIRARKMVVVNWERRWKEIKSL